MDLSIAAATAATAFFTFLAATVAWLAYIQRRVAAGAHKPVVVRGPRRSAPQLFPSDEYARLAWGRATDEDSLERVRVFDPYMINRSQIPQLLTIDRYRGLIVLWPRFHRKHKPRLFGEDPFELPPNGAGNVIFRLVYETGKWPSGGMEDHYWFKGRYFVHLSIETATGHRARYLGWVRLRPYEGQDTDTF